MLRIFVALGKQLPNNKKIIEDTQEVARLMAKYNCTMVQGGAKMGLMGLVVQEFQKYSDEVVMIVPEVHKSDLIGAKNKEYYIVEGESDRMRITIHTCDMMIVLPGGSGTLAELAYYNETCKSGEHNAKIVVVNSDGYYNKLFKFMKSQVKHGFMKTEHCMFDIIKSAKDLEPILQQVIAQKQAQIQQEEIEANKKKLAEAKAKQAKPKTTKAKQSAKIEDGKTAKSKKVNSQKSTTATKSASSKSAKVAKPVAEEKVNVAPKAKTTTKKTS